MNLQSQQIPGVPTQHKPVEVIVVFKIHPIALMASMVIDKKVCTAGNTNIVHYSIFGLKILSIIRQGHSQEGFQPMVVG